MEDLYRTRDAMVAFIDMLGASKQIKNNADMSLIKMHSAYDIAMELYGKLPAAKQELIKVRIFSDNIVIYAFCDEGGARASFYAVTKFAALIQARFTQMGILIRGGIARGSFFADELMIWGQALVDAYSLENSISIYPRVVIHPDIVEALIDADSIDTEWLAQDTDGLWFVDYINEKTIKGYRLDLFLCHGNCLTDILNNKDGLKVAQKMHWHRNYLESKFTDEMNATLNKFREKKDVATLFSATM